MAKEPKICPYCNLEITSDQDSLTTQSGVPYHKVCYENINIDSMVATIEKKYPSSDAKLARIISQNNIIIASAEKTQGHLSTIKTIIVIFMILTIVAAILQGCSALMSGY